MSRDRDRNAPAGRLDRIVVLRAAAAGSLLAVPAALANVVLASQDPKPQGTLALTYFLALAGFVLAGFVAGREAPAEAARHGAFAALGTFVPVEAIALLGRLDRGEGLSIPGVVVVAFLAALGGLAGARLGVRRRARLPRLTDPGGSPS